jgi:N6-L-threonylcarbamoyladenine synthase
LAKADNIKNMRILAIETSCDDTGVALLESKGAKIKVLADTIVSQTKIHEQYGGVFPMKAKIAHSQNLVPALLTVLKNPKTNKKPISKAKLSKIKKTSRKRARNVLCN